MNKIEEFRKSVTDKFIELLDKEGLNWSKGWQDTEADLFSPISVATEKGYNGINRIYLAMIAIDRGYKDNRWTTFYHIKEKGWTLKDAKGHGVKVEYWFPYDKDNEAITWKEYAKLSDEEKGKCKIVPKYFTVFNADLIEGIEPLDIEQPILRDIELNDIVDVISNNMNVEILNDGGNRAYYSRLEDKIHLPLAEYFYSDYDYNSTLLHELSHATGSANRLNREKGLAFGDDKYAYEELVAEISSCFTSHDIGLKTTDYHIKNHASYVKSWIEQLKEKPQTLFSAISDAEKASAYLLKNLDIDLNVSKTLKVDIQSDNKVKVIDDKKVNLNKKLRLKKQMSL